VTAEPRPSPWRTPRWWVTTALVLVGVLACVGLGAWQYDRARTRDTPQGPSDPMSVTPLELTAALPADGRVLPGSDPVAVAVRGTYDAEHQLLVPGRTQDAQPVSYVVTPLLMDDGRGVLVVRGWIPEGSNESPAPPLGRVSVTGWLVHSEPLEAATVDPLSLPREQVATVTAARVLDLVPYPLVDGYVGLVSESSVADGPIGPVAFRAPAPLPVPLVEPGVRWSVQSLSYAIEWWFFALAGIWMWVLALRIERRRLATEPSVAVLAASAGGAAGPPDQVAVEPAPPGG